MRRLSGLWLALLVVVGTLASGCALTGTSLGPATGLGSPDPSADDGIGYTPYTEDTIVPAIRSAVAAHRSYHLVMRSAGARMTMDVRLRVAGEAEMRTSLTGPDAMEMIAVDGDVYVRVPPAVRWTKLSAEGAERFRAQVGDVTPGQFAADLAAGMQSLDFAGRDDVGRLQLYRYHVTVDPDFARAQADQLGDDVPLASMPQAYDMWLDPDGLLRRAVLDVMGQEIVVTMSRWGQPVVIEAPAESEIDLYSA